MPRIAISHLTYDPTEPQNDPLFFSFLQGRSYISAYTPCLFYDSNKKEHFYISFTHPTYQFTKPQRTSAGSSQLKPEQTYYGVFEPTLIGKGSFGGLYPELGIWKLDDQSWHFKTKKDPLKARLVKTNAIRDPKIEKNEFHESAYTNYCEEQKVGQYIKHMGMSSAASGDDHHAFLRMRKLPGKSLNKLLDTENLTVTQRLKLSINLLKEIDSQVHNISLYENGQKIYVVHNDIKPQNIIVTRQMFPYFVDFGIAKCSTDDEGVSSGTRSYTAPETLLQPNKPSDKITDLGALYRVITEIFGDSSSLGIKNTDDALARNANKDLTDLFAGIPVSPNEEFQLRILFNKMIENDGKNRPSREKVLEVLESLLKHREQERNKELKVLVKRTPFNDIKSQDLLEILQSKYAKQFIEKLAQEPQNMRLLSRKLNSRLLDLDEPTLRLLQIHGFNFSRRALFDRVVNKRKDISASEIKLLAELGMPVNAKTLKKWLMKPITSGNELHWMTVCRALYDIIPNADEILNEEEIPDRFKSIFCEMFLSNYSKEHYDQSTLRLINKHFEIDAIIRNKICKLNEILDEHFSEDPETQKNIIHMFQDILIPEYMVCEPPEFKFLYDQFARLHDINHLFLTLAERPGSDARTEAITKLLSTLDEAQELFKTDIDAALIKHRTLRTPLDRIDQIDKLIDTLKNANLPDYLKYLISQLEAYYLDTTVSLKELELNVQYLCDSAKLLEHIEAVKQSGVALDADSSLNLELQDMLCETSFAHANELFNGCDGILRMFSHAAKLNNQLLNDIGAEPEGSKRSAVLNKFIDTLKFRMNSSAAEELVKFISQFKKCTRYEKKLMSKLEEYPLSKKFIYTLLLENYPEYLTSKVGKLKKILQRLDELPLLDTSTLPLLESILNSRSIHTNEDMKQKLVKTIWRYIHTEKSLDQISDHKLSMIQELARLQRTTELLDSVKDSTQRLFASNAKSQTDVILTNSETSEHTDEFDARM